MRSTAGTMGATNAVRGLRILTTQQEVSMKRTWYFQCPKATRHLCGIGDVYCELCGMNIITGHFPIQQPYKSPVKIVQEYDDSDEWDKYTLT